MGTLGTGCVTTENYEFLRDYLMEVCGLALGTDKGYFLESRLLPVAEERRLRDLNGLCMALRSNHDRVLQTKVIEAVTTNETLFFRDVAPFQALQSTIIPAVMERNQASRSIRIWSAAASSGQEAYSLVMMLLEMGFGDWSIEVVGTDISEDILNRARQGLYRQIEVNRGLPAALLLKYFTSKGRDWQISDDVKRRVRFEQFDLRRDFRSLGLFDMVFCRNVLIYFDRVGKLDIVTRIGRTLRPGGLLLLGAAESIFEPEAGYDRVAIEGVMFYRLKGAA